jgi:hypothetical protein
MKYIKSLGLFVVAAAAMMAFAASASATTVTGPSGETTPTIHAVNENGHVNIHNSIVDIQCSSTFEGTVSSHGAGVTASGNISTLQFNNCTNEWVVDVTTNGSFEVHATSTTGHGTGSFTSSGMTITATRAGISCSYMTNSGTSIGTLTGGTPATLRVEATIHRHAGSFLCGGTTTFWTGSYVTTSTLKIDA